MTRSNHIRAKYSDKYDQLLYVLKVDGFSREVLFDREALELLRRNIDQALAS